jgi:hypothetical protein
MQDPLKPQSTSIPPLPRRGSVLRFVRGAVSQFGRQKNGILATGYTSNAIVHHRRLDLGMHVIEKHFIYAELATKVRRTLDGD